MPQRSLKELFVAALDLPDAARAAFVEHVVTLRQLVLQSVRHLRHHLPFIAEKRAALRGAQ